MQIALKPFRLGARTFRRGAEVDISDVRILGRLAARGLVTAPVATPRARKAAPGPLDGSPTGAGKPSSSSAPARAPRRRRSTSQEDGPAS